MYEGLRVRGIWEILRKPVRKRARKVPLKGNARLGLWKSRELALSSQASKGQRRGRQGMRGLGFGNRASTTKSGRQEWGIVA